MMAYALDHVITTGGECTAQGPCVYEEICPTMKAAGPHAVAIIEEAADSFVMCLNDQGGTVMHVTYDITEPLRAQMKHHEPIVLVYDARGNGGGGVAPSLTGDHQDRVTDYTAIVVEKNDEDIQKTELQRVDGR